MPMLILLVVVAVLLLPLELLAYLLAYVSSSSLPMSPKDTSDWAQCKWLRIH